MLTHQYHDLANLFSCELDQSALDLIGHDPRFSSFIPEDIQEARIEFTRLFAMTIYPYASVFLGTAPEMNGESTAKAELFYERVGFELPSDWMIGAPDALGAELECLASLLDRGRAAESREFLREHILPWAPVCLIAVERISKFGIYQELARIALDNLLTDSQSLGDTVAPGEDESELAHAEMDLYRLVEHLVAPARCGFFLSKSDLQGIAREIDVPIGFGDRGLILEGLMKSAGSEGRIAEGLEAIRTIGREWTAAYNNWEDRYPASAWLWRVWKSRTGATDAMLTEMLLVARDASGSD